MVRERIAGLAFASVVSESVATVAIDGFKCSCRCFFVQACHCLVTDQQQLAKFALAASFENMLESAGF